MRPILIEVRNTIKLVQNATTILDEDTYESNRSSGSRSNHWVVPASRFTDRRSMCFCRTENWCEAE